MMHIGRYIKRLLGKRYPMATLVRSDLQQDRYNARFRHIQRLNSDCLRKRPGGLDRKQK